MSSTLKIAVPLLLLIGAIFALTLFSQYGPRDEEEKPPEAVAKRKPLQFFTSRRLWVPEWMLDRNDPEYMTKLNLQDQIYPFYFEAGETEHKTGFWFANPNPEAVEMRLKAVSCETCSGGQVGILPPDMTKQILQMTAIGTLPTGPVAGLPLGLIAPSALLDPRQKKVQWQQHRFDKKELVRYDVPGVLSGDPWAVQWGILELQFKVRPGAGGMGGLVTLMSTNLQGSEERVEERFELGYAAASPFEVDRESIDVGELTDASPSQTNEILVFSMTRATEDLQRNLKAVIGMPPGVSGEPGPFVTAGEPIALPERELVQLEKKMSAKAAQGENPRPPVRVQSAFRVPVTVNPKIGKATLDIGRVERLVRFAQGSEVKLIRVFGTMRGPISLVGAREIAFNYFTYADEHTLSAPIETNRAGLELAIVPELTNPKFLKAELIKQPDIGERGSYKLKVTIPAKEQLGQLKDGVVVVESKGADSIRLRIPITGHGR